MPRTTSRKLPFSDLSYNASTGRYFRAKAQGGNGLFIREDAVRALIDDDIDHGGERLLKNAAPLKDAARKFKAGQISQDDYLEAVRKWRSGHDAELKGLHLANGAVDKGGFHRMDAQSNGAVVLVSDLQRGHRGLRWSPAQYKHHAYAHHTAACPIS